jgi:hypothetical protein
MYLLRPLWANLAAAPWAARSLSLGSDRRLLAFVLLCFFPGGHGSSAVGRKQGAIVAHCGDDCCCWLAHGCALGDAGIWRAGGRRSCTSRGPRWALLGVLGFFCVCWNQVCGKAAVVGQECGDLSPLCPPACATPQNERLRLLFPLVESSKARQTGYNLTLWRGNPEHMRAATKSWTC